MQNFWIALQNPPSLTHCEGPDEEARYTAGLLAIAAAATVKIKVIARRLLPPSSVRFGCMFRCRLPACRQEVTLQAQHQISIRRGGVWLRRLEKERAARCRKASPRSGHGPNC
jgi:hypothetical protein